MKYLFNTEKLNKVLSDFYKSTNIAITLYDANENLVATSSIFSGYCSYVRSREDCVRCCDNSNSLHMKEVARTKKTVSYTCHAGLMETITPIIYEGVIIAYIQIGQYKDNEIFYSSRLFSLFALRFSRFSARRSTSASFIAWSASTVLLSLGKRSFER